MKHIVFLLTLVALATAPSMGQNLKPYTIGAETTGTVAAAEDQVKQNLQKEGITVLGAYSSRGDANRRVLAITSDDLRAAVGKVGGLTGFAAVLRVGITQENGKVIVSYTTPEYWGNAYFRNEYGKVATSYSAFSKKLMNALTPLGGRTGETFGSQKGLTADKLQDYRYMMGMPDFSKTVTLATFPSYQAAVSKIDANLAQGKKDLVKVYALEIPGKNLKLYGIGLKGDQGEAAFLPKIDIASPQHTAAFPYEVLVMGNEVHMLHGRFRLALSFPDLKMGQFMKIVATPGNIEDLLRTATQ